MDNKTLQTEILEQPYNHEKWVEVLKHYFGARRILAHPQEIKYSNSYWTENVDNAFELGSFYTSGREMEVQLC